MRYEKPWEHVAVLLLQRKPVKQHLCLCTFPQQNPTKQHIGQSDEIEDIAVKEMANINKKKIDLYIYFY
jgi:hypothetical protein